MLAALEKELQHQQDVVVADAEAKAETEMRKELQAERARLQAEVDDAFLVERGARTNEAMQARLSLNSLEEVLKQDAASVLASVQDNSSLALAAVSLDEAVGSDRSASAEFDALRATSERV